MTICILAVLFATVAADPFTISLSEDGSEVTLENAPGTIVPPAKFTTPTGCTVARPVKHGDGTYSLQLDAGTCSSGETSEVRVEYSETTVTAPPTPAPTPVPPTPAPTTACSANALQAHYTFDGHWTATNKGSHNWATAKQGSSYEVPGMHDTALNFDGNDRIQVHAGGAVSENNFGISMWFKTSNENAGGLFCVDHHGHDRHFGLRSNRMYIRTWPHGNQHPGDSGMASNTWRHAVYTVGPSGEKIFVDGSRIHYRSHVTRSHYSWDNFAYIGYSTDLGYFNGQIDDVRIFSNELSQAEVSQLFSGCQ